jgi:hypothetical protein
VNALKFDLKTMALRHGVGSFTTRAQRHRGLQLCARDLSALGYKLPGASSLKPKHVEALVAHWRAQGLSAGTMKNRMGWLRTWAGIIRKPNIIPRENKKLGVGDRQAFNGNRAYTSGPEKLSALPQAMQLAVRMQMAFGLRLEESLKFRPDVADKINRLDLQASWCKGGRARSIPITHPRQIELLKELHAFCGKGSLIPQGQKYVDFRKEVERATHAAGITNMHGHRHWYAQWRYKTLTGLPCPAAGGNTYERLSNAQRAADHKARMQISAELGHNRLNVTDVYLGSRFAPKAAQ